MASSIGQNGQRIGSGDYVKIPYAQVGASPGAQTSYIGVALVVGGPNISGVYLTNAGTTAPFSDIPANQCQQLGQAAGPGNAGYGNAQN